MMCRLCRAGGSLSTESTAVSMSGVPSTSGSA